VSSNSVPMRNDDGRRAGIQPNGWVFVWVASCAEVRLEIESEGLPWAAELS